MQIPVNRWTVGLATLVILVFGNDFVEPLYRVIGVLSASHIPAM